MKFSVSENRFNFWYFKYIEILFKDCLPYLFHSFRNKYFNKISLGNMLYSQGFKKMHGFPINMQWKIIFRVKCKLPVSSWPIRVSILTTCVMWSCTGNFLIRARDCDVWINLFLSNEAISIAVRDFFKLIIILGVKLVLTKIILSTIYQINN